MNLDMQHDEEGTIEPTEVDTILHGQLVWTDGYLRRAGVYALLKDATSA